ncbi:hypothetical protein [Treponema socranskii]|uniref:hypothetical protein n=1 Tax=Treponema socranskii TaxID=53419 RepID=UPI003D6E7357
MVHAIGSHEVTKSEIQRLAGVPRGSINNVIDMLSIRYTLYDVRYGVYKFLKAPE